MTNVSLEEEEEEAEKKVRTTLKSILDIGGSLESILFLSHRKLGRRLSNQQSMSALKQRMRGQLYISMSADEINVKMRSTQSTWTYRRNLVFSSFSLRVCVCVCFEPLRTRHVKKARRNLLFLSLLLVLMISKY